MATRTVHGSITLLTRLARETHRRSGVMDISLKHFGVLSILRDDGKLTQGRLAEILCVDANMVVTLLNDLEERGFAERRRDPDDRRRHIVAITSEGRKALREAERRLDTIEDDVLGKLDAKQRAELHELLRQALDG